jgi:serine/threonine-protein kinase HipA
LRKAAIKIENQLAGWLTQDEQGYYFVYDKKNLKKQDFVSAMNTLKVEEKQQENIFNKMLKARPKWHELIDNSFISDAFKEQYKVILTERMNRLQ